MMTREQIKVLTSDLGALRRPYPPQRKKTPAVRSAEKIIAAFEREQERKRARLGKAYTKLHGAARREIHFGTEKTAFRAIEQLRRFVESNGGE